MVWNFYLWYYADAQKVPDFRLFQVSEFWIEYIKAVCCNLFY